MLWVEAGLLPKHEGGIEDLNHLNIRSCRWRPVPVVYSPLKEPHLIHCDIGV